MDRGRVVSGGTFGRGPVGLFLGGSLIYQGTLGVTIRSGGVNMAKGDGLVRGSYHPETEFLEVLVDSI